MKRVATKTRRRDLDPRTRQRVLRVIQWLDGARTAWMIDLYVSRAIEQYGSVEAALEADECDMAAEGFEQ